MARFDRLTVLNTVLQDGLVPLFYHKDVEAAQHVADALANGKRVLFVAEKFEHALSGIIRRHLHRIVIGVAHTSFESDRRRDRLLHAANCLLTITHRTVPFRICLQIPLQPFVFNMGTIEE